MQEPTDPHDPHNPNSSHGRSRLVKIIAQGGKDAGKTWTVDKPVFVIGSAEDCDLRVPDGQLSPFHAYLFVRDHVVTLRHLGPPPVISVNGRLMRWGELRNDDCIMLGSSAYRIELPTVPMTQGTDLPWGFSESDSSSTPDARFTLPS